MNELDEAFAADRGIRVIDNAHSGSIVAFRWAIADYQASHPDTIVRVTQQLNRVTGISHLEVRWWPRGEAPEP